MKFGDSDALRDRKCIHIQLRKDVHAALRARLFKRGLSMQEVIDEFAKLFVIDDPRATELVEEFTIKKVQGVLSRSSTSYRLKTESSELDHEALYNMIEGSNNDRKEDKDAG